MFVSPRHHFHFTWENEFAFAHGTSRVVKVASCTQDPHWREPADLMNSAGTSRLILDKFHLGPEEQLQMFSQVFKDSDRQTSTRHAEWIPPTWPDSTVPAESICRTATSCPANYDNDVGVDTLLLLLSDGLKPDHIVTHHYSCKWCQELLTEDTLSAVWLIKRPNVNNPGLNCLLTRLCAGV